MNLTVVIPALNEDENLRSLLPMLAETLSGIFQTYEIIVVNGPSSDDTEQVVNDFGARVVAQIEPGYGGALATGFREAAGEYILTLDADLSHDPVFIHSMWQAIQDADVVIASRYVKGGDSNANWFRKLLSVVLNAIIGRLLAVQILDLSSGFRLYRSCVVKGMSFNRRDFAVLIEIIVQAYARGWSVKEVPFSYFMRKHGRSHAQVIRFGFSYLVTLHQMWKLRNSIACADYDARAYDSRVLFQRYWQRRRHQIVTQFAQGTQQILDIGCGSSRILADLKGATVGLDVQLSKLRYARRYNLPLVNGNIFQLPFNDNSFDCVICSQVIEHLVEGDEPFDEMLRVLRPGGKLVLGTPDYGTILWPVIERVYGIVAPGAYADEHITHYTKDSLTTLLESYGLIIQESRYVFGSELIMEAIKP